MVSSQEKAVREIEMAMSGGRRRDALGMTAADAQSVADTTGFSQALSRISRGTQTFGSPYLVGLAAALALASVVMLKIQGVW
jgi:hypothetical protein